MMYYIVKCRKGEENMLITKSYVIKYISTQINTHIDRLIINGIFTDYISLPSYVKLLVLLFSYCIVRIQKPQIKLLRLFFSVLHCTCPYSDISTKLP